MDGESFGSAERAQFLLALGNNSDTFSYADSVYYYVNESEDVYRILRLEPVAEEMIGIFRPLVGDTVPDALQEAFQSAVDNKLNAFTWMVLPIALPKTERHHKFPPSTTWRLPCCIFTTHIMNQTAKTVDRLRF